MVRRTDGLNAVRLTALVSTLERSTDDTGRPVVVAAPGPHDTDPEVSGVRCDSRVVGPGDLFACIVGANADGHDHAPDAVARGAVGLLVERPLPIAVSQVVVPDVRRALGPLAAQVYGNPSRDLDVVGVTGTNGKTTVVHLLQSVLAEAGLRCGVIGTLTGTRTTPEAPELQERLAQERDAGVQVVAMEVSSHALAMRRVDGTQFRAAGFTNLSRDHLDFHGDLDSYFAAKARLFEPELSQEGVVNGDDPYGRRLVERARIPLTVVHPDGLADLELAWDHSSFGWRQTTVRCPLPGRVNAANALVALELAFVLGAPPETAARGLATAAAVPGRFEVVDRGQPFAVIVDYAHTPDGLERLLGSVRELISGSMSVVFGCGGDRDPGKRPLMGEVAARLADTVVITDDNPRTEDPAAIAAAIRAGAGDQARVRIVPDRRQAITEALAGARDHDAVVIAGKGHEAEQIVGDDRFSFLDAWVAAEQLAELGYRSSAAHG